MANKPGIYLDTSILSALHYDGSNELGITRRITTRDWWTHERLHFELYTSIVTERELLRGKFRWQGKAVAEALRIKYLAMSNEVEFFARTYLEMRLIPDTKTADAFQLAFATVYRIDYVLSWNYAHLANAEVQRKLLEVNMRMGCRTPWLVSPESIPNAAMGQQIRRRD